jgi:hypothetical protein
MENMHNGEKRRKTEHISVNNGPQTWKKIVDPCFLNCMGWIKPENYFTPLSLTGAQAWDIRRRIFYTNLACMGRWLTI